MTTTEIQAAIIRRLLAMPDAPNIVLPDGDDQPLPRIAVFEAGGQSRTVSVRGRVRREPEVAMRVEVKSGAGAAGRIAMASQIEDWFAVGTRFEGVTVVNPPKVRPAFNDEFGVNLTPIYVSAVYEG